MSNIPPPNTNFPKFTKQLPPRARSTSKPEVPSNKKTSVIFTPIIPENNEKKPLEPYVSKGFGFKGKMGGPPGMFKTGKHSNLSSKRVQIGLNSPTPTTQMAPWAPLPPIDSTEIKVEAVVQKRKEKKYNQSEIAPTAQSMNIDPLDLDHPLTLPFLDPYKIKSMLSDKIKPTDDDETQQFDSQKTDLKENFQRTSDDLFKNENGDFVGEDQIFFIQLPSALPIGIPTKTNAENSEILGFKSTISHIPSGKIGKFQIYKSGKVKLKIGDTLFDVSSGMSCNFLQEVVMLSPELKKIFQLGEVTKRMVCYPDISNTLSKTLK